MPAALCVLSWLGAGWLPRAGMLGDPLVDLLTRFAVGSAAIALVLFVSGRAGVFERGAILALTVVLAVVGAWRAARLPVPRPPRGRVTAVLLSLVAVALAVDVVAASAPPTSADALKYHLALPELWLDTGAITDAFWRWESFSPFGVEMLFAQGLALGGGEVAAILHAAFGVLAAAAVYALARDLGVGSAVAGAAGAALFVLQGLVTWEATSSFVELGLVFYGTLAAVHVLRFARTRDVAPAVVAGAVAGAGAGTRYLGLAVAGLVLAPLAVLAPRRAFLLAGAAAALVAAPWYVKNLIVTGNPVYPVFFGGDLWTAVSEQELAAVDARYGHGSSPLRLAILPVDLLLHGERFDRGEYVGTGIFLLAALAVVVARSRALVAAAGGAAVYLVLWWELSPQARFLLPALAVLAAVGGVGAAAWLQRGRVRFAAVVVVFAAGTVAWAAASGALARQLVPPVFGAETRDAHVQRLTGTYDGYRAVARDVDGVVAMGGHLLPYAYPERAIALDAPEFASDVPPRERLERLRDHEVAYILVPEVDGRAPMLDPLSPCLARERGYDARLVLSRTRGTSIPWPLGLYRVRGDEPQCAAS